MSDVPKINSARLHLVKLAATYPYGRIENLHIREGDPCMSPPPLVVEDWKVTPIKKSLSVNATPKISNSWLSFFSKLDEIQNTILLKVVIQDGAPVRVEAPRYPNIPSGG